MIYFLVFIAACILATVIDAYQHRRRALASGDPAGSIWYHIQQSKREDDEKRAKKKAARKDAAILKKNASLSISAQKTGEEKARQIHLAQQASIARDIAWQNRLAGKNPQPPPANHLAQRSEMVNDAASQNRHAAKKSAPKPAVQAPVRQNPAASRRKTAGLPDRITFLYENADGEIANRDVNVHAVNSNARGGYYIEGYCKMAGDNRTFRIDRVIGMITRSTTGEVLLPDAWLAEVANLRPKKLPVAEIKKQPPSVMFTGFKSAERAALEAQAEAVGWRIRKTVSQTLDYLVTGGNAGPAKIRDADALNIAILDEVGFLELIKVEAEAY